MAINLPEFCLVALIGAAGAGKTTFARRHFVPAEIASVDWVLGLIDDAGSLEAVADAHDIARAIADKRLKRRRLTVVDAANLAHEERAALVRLAKQHYALAHAIVLDPGEDACHAHNRARTDRNPSERLVRAQQEMVRHAVEKLESEGFNAVHHLSSTRLIDDVRIVREPLWPDRRGEHGPFDIVGDVHGCADELVELMSRLGYRVRLEGEGGGRRAIVDNPPGRRLVLVGDLVDRGPRVPDVLRIAMAMVETGQALCVPGNHDNKFMRWLQGRNVRLTHGLDRSVAQMEAEPAELKGQARAFLESLGSHLWLDGGRLVVAHAGIAEAMIGRSTGAVREFCLFGDTDGETDQFGLSIRYHWAAAYAGTTTIVYGHTPVADADWVNNTLCIDTGCCFGGKLTALRWPEREIVSVPARRTYAEQRRPFGHPEPRPDMGRRPR